MTERLLVPRETLQADERAPVSLADEAAHHLRVLRVSVGDALVLFDGHGLERDANVLSLSRNGATVSLRGAPREGATADVSRVTWLQGYPKGDKLDLIVRQATELGVAAIRPVYTARSVPRDRDDRGAARVSRWLRIAEEAARQSGRADVPEVLPPMSLDEALRTVPAQCPLRIVAWERATRPLLEVVRAAPPGDAVVLAGPEGGLDTDEVARCEAQGFTAVSLGARVLRAETVAPALLAVLSALRGDLAAASHVR